jgi:hypothetical protein
LRNHFKTPPADFFGTNFQLSEAEMMGFVVTKYTTSGFVYRLQAGQCGGQTFNYEYNPVFVDYIYANANTISLAHVVICGDEEIATATGVNKDKYNIIPS